MDLYYSGKSKDLTVYRILHFSHKLSEKNMKLLKWGIIIIPMIMLIIFNYFIEEKTIVIIIAINFFSIIFLIYAISILIDILKFDTGNEQMIEIAEAIKEGAEGFFAILYGMIFKLSIIFGFTIFIFYIILEISSADKIKISLGPIIISIYIMLSFFFGAFFSALSGYGGIWVNVRTNIRVASAALRCYNEALTLSFKGGLFSSIINTALAIFGITFLFLCAYITMYIFLDSNYYAYPFEKIPLLLVGFGFGASLVAMFAQLGGGICTQAAVVGADLIGKIELGMNEDDARNPAVIADLVGDNVGQCAGQAADLFESISAGTISAMILGCALSEKMTHNENSKGGFIIFPLVIHCLDLFVSVIGSLFVRARPGLPAGGTDYQDVEDPVKVMKRGYKISIFLGAIGIVIVSYFFLNTPSVKISEMEPNNYAWLYFVSCALIGIIDTYLFRIITKVYTDYNYPSVKAIAVASQTGSATNIISGLSVGMESTSIPCLLIAISLIGSYNLGQKANIIEENLNYLSGFYGTAVTTMGMFVSAVFILAMSGFSPIADNACGIVEMSVHESSLRIISHRLLVGNDTKASIKGYSAGTSSLVCFLLLSAFMAEISLRTDQDFKIIDIAQVEVFISGLLGSAVVFLFASFALSSVGVAAQAVIKEVRNQIKSDASILVGKSKPNYKQCVEIISKAGMKEMIKPGLLAVCSPIIVGIFFKLFGYVRKKYHLGAQCTASFLMFCTSTGILMALFLNNAGGAWENTKKYIETGALGGRNSDTHKAAITGDTIGDPCKDTAGPSIHILIKLVSTISLILAPLFA